MTDLESAASVPPAVDRSGADTRPDAGPRPDAANETSAIGAATGSGTVGLWRGDDRCENLRRAMSPVMDDIDWPTRRRVVVKPNLVTPEVPLSVTDPQALDTVLSEIRRRYDGPLAVAEGCAVTPTPQAFADMGFDTLAREHGADLVDLNTDEAVPLSVYDRRGRPLALRMARSLLDSDCRVSLSVPKTHDTVLVTLSIKNLVMGGLANRQLTGRHTGTGPVAGVRRRVRGSRLLRSRSERNDKLAMHQGYGVINVNLALLAAEVLPDLAVLDGFEAMECAGPSLGNAVPWRVAVAGTRALAVDGLTAALMGFPPDEVGYLHYCARLGLGELSPACDEVVGNVTLDEVRRDFAPHPGHRAQRAWDVPDAAPLFAQAARVDLATHRQPSGEQ